MISVRNLVTFSTYSPRVGDVIMNNTIADYVFCVFLTFNTHGYVVRNLINGLTYGVGKGTELTVIERL